MCKCVCVCVYVCEMHSVKRIGDEHQPSSKRGAMPAATLPRDGALKLGSEAGEWEEAPTGHSTVTTQVAYVMWHSIYQKILCFLIILVSKHTQINNEKKIFWHFKSTSEVNILNVDEHCRLHVNIHLVSICQKRKYFKQTWHGAVFKTYKYIYKHTQNNLQ